VGQTFFWGAGTDHTQHLDGVREMPPQDSEGPMHEYEHTSFVPALCTFNGDAGALVATT
jgi:hypothetical protein